MRGASILKANDDKTRALNDHCILAFSGEAGDTSMFSSFFPFSSPTTTPLPQARVLASS